MGAQEVTLFVSFQKVKLLTIGKTPPTFAIWIFSQLDRAGNLLTKPKIWKGTIAIRRGPPARILFRSSIQTTLEQKFLRLRSPGECSGLLVEFVFLCGCYFQAKTAPVPKDGKGDGFQAQVAVS